MILAKKIDFPPNLGVFEGNLWVFQMVGNRQTQKKIFFQAEKFMENMFDILKYASECQIDAIFVIKKKSSFVTQSFTFATSFEIEL